MPRVLVDDAYRSVVGNHQTFTKFDTPFPEVALVIAVEREPDAILLDLSMPGAFRFRAVSNALLIKFHSKNPHLHHRTRRTKQSILSESWGAALLHETLGFCRANSGSRLGAQYQKVEVKTRFARSSTWPLTLRGKGQMARTLRPASPQRTMSNRFARDENPEKYAR